MRISVALCTCNGEVYLEQQLDSLLGQSRRPDELVVCDDSSIDHTQQILHRFRAEAPFPVKLQVNPRNLGTTKNFEQAVELCDGDVIAYCDQDDVWHPEKLKIFEETFLRRPLTAMVVSDARVVDQHLRTLFPSLWSATRFQRKVRENQPLPTDALLKRNPVFGFALAFRSVFKPLILPFPAGQGHDTWTALVISLVGDIAPIPEQLVSYRQHSTQQVGAMESIHPLQRAKVSRTCSAAQRAAQIELLSAALTRVRESGIEIKCERNLELVNAKISHLQARATLPKGPIRRLQRVIGELARLNYHRYSSGISSAFLDLFR